MTETDVLHQGIESDIEHYTETTLPPFQHQWPLLGKELFAMEQTLTDILGPNQQPLTEREKREKREKIRNTIIAQLYRDEETYPRDMRYLAFLLLKQGRGGEIVGDPFTMEKGARKLLLPYTGLEGYYAGSERTSKRPGMAQEEIIQEEANIGTQLLKTVKKHYIQSNSWVSFSRLKRVLEGADPDIEELRNTEVLWSMVVRQLHARIYHNQEFELTLSEQIEQLEQLLRETPGRTMEEKRLKSIVQAEYDQLKQKYENMSEAEWEQERRERRERGRIRANRLEEFQRFRDETYQIFTQSGQGRYIVSVQDDSLVEATIIETATLPKIPGRNMYPPTNVHLTPEQLEGYMFLVKLGEIGGDPLARSALVSQ